MTGQAAVRGVEMWVDEINKKGGLLGRRVEFVQRDTHGKPEEAVHWAREFASSGDIDFLFAIGGTAEAYSVAAISKELKKVIFFGCMAAEFTENPKLRSPNCFRAAQNNFFDNIVAAQYAAKKAKELGLKRWYTIAEDYQAGREVVGLFAEYLKKFDPDVQIVGQSWPKLGESVFTPDITAIMAAKPDAIYNHQWAGDMTAFLQQGSMYGLLDKGKWFFKDLDEYPVIASIEKGVGKFPAGLYAAAVYARALPDTKDNHDFNDTHVKRYGSPPLAYTWPTYTSCLLLEAAVNKAKTTETEAVIRALKDSTVKSPMGVGPNGTVTLRGRDNQLINYAAGWGVTISHDPYLTDIVAGSWDDMLKEETAWVKSKGWQ
jgi:branched-chain amino acid transport system substrate-binding protein